MAVILRKLKAFKNVVCKMAVILRKQNAFENVVCKMAVIFPGLIVLITSLYPTQPPVIRSLFWLTPSTLENDFLWEVNHLLFHSSIYCWILGL